MEAGAGAAAEGVVGNSCYPHRHFEKADSWGTCPAASAGKAGVVEEASAGRMDLNWTNRTILNSPSTQTPPSIQDKFPGAAGDPMVSHENVKLKSS